MTATGRAAPAPRRARLNAPAAWRRLWTLARYLAAGAGSLGADLAFQAALLEGLGTGPSFAIPVAYEMSLVAHFVVNDRWVFSRGTYGEVTPRPAWQRFAAFQVSAAIPQAVTIGLALFLVDGPWAAEFADWWGSYAAKVLGTAAGFLWNLLVNFLVIWRPAAASGASAGHVPASTR